MAEEKKTREQINEEMKRELYIEKAFLNEHTFEDGRTQQQVAFTPRVRGDVDEKYPGMYPSNSKTKAGKTNTQEYMSVEKFNGLMEQTGSELRVDKEQGQHQFIGADTPADERPLMRARSQGYKFEEAQIKSGDRKGQTYNKPVPANKDEAVKYSIVAGDASGTNHPEFDKEKNHEIIKERGEANKAKKAEKEAKEAPEKDDAEVELPQ